MNPDPILQTVKRLSASEEIDERLIVVTPKNWLALFSLLAILAALLLWAIFGEIPVTVKGQAIYLNEEEIYASVPLIEGQKIRKGAPVLLEFLGVEKGKFGSVRGEVADIFLTPPAAILPYLKPLGSTLFLKVTPHRSDTPSGLQWTSEKGPPYRIEPGSLGEVTIRIETIKPYTYIFPLYDAG